MPKFYIHFRNAGKLAEDDVGQDLASLDEARVAALASAREIVAENIKHNSAHPLLEVIVADEGGKQLLTISAKDVLPAAWK